MKVTQTQCTYMVPNSDSPTGYLIQVIPECKSWWMGADDIKLNTFEQEFEVDIPAQTY